MAAPIPPPTLVYKLFTDWELSAWADVLGIVGFGVSTAGLIYTGLVKSEISKLKMTVLFDNRIDTHIKKLTKITGNLNEYFNDYNASISKIKIEIATAQSELSDLKNKLSSSDSKTITSLLRFIKKRRKKIFTSYIDQEKKWHQRFVDRKVKFYFQTTYDDVWIIYEGLHEIVEQMKNIKENRKKATI
jgi:hypothetical protein